MVCSTLKSYAIIKANSSCGWSNLILSTSWSNIIARHRCHARRMLNCAIWFLKRFWCKLYMTSRRKRAANWTSEGAMLLPLQIDLKSIGGPAKLDRVKDSSQLFMSHHIAPTHKNKNPSTTSTHHIIIVWPIN